MKLTVGDVVRIACVHSKYHGIVGEIFKLQNTSRYAVVDMPKGTEWRLERIAENAIIAEMKRLEKTRKTPVDRWPQGDPQWFPHEWLIVVQKAHSDCQSDIMEEVAK
jgi:hypothetical protein